MKTFPHLLFFLLILTRCSVAKAQNNEDARALVKEGQALNDEKKYTEAIDKYNQALKLDSANLFADYQMASSLFASGRGNDGIPYLNKVISENTPLKAAAYDLLGLIYFTDKHFAEAEKAAVEAIKLDPKHASSQRMYALVCFHQNERAAALLGFCSFILLEPGTARSAEAYGNIQHILQGGALKPEPGVMVSHAIEADTYTLNQAITKAVADAGKEKHATAADGLAAQLKGIFDAVGEIAQKQTGNDFFRNYMAAYFYQMTQSANMPAFARLISQSTPESAKWVKDNAQQMADLDSWVKATERGF